MAEEENKKGGKPADDEIDEEDEDLEDEDLEDDEVDDEDEDQGEDDEESEEAKKKKAEEEAKKAEMEERARQAKARREREAKKAEEEKKRIEREAYLKGKLESTKVNTFTNQPIEDEYDLKVFELQKEIEKEGGDPINDLPKRMAKLERETRSKAKLVEEEQVKEQEHIKQDIRGMICRSCNGRPSAWLANS